MFIGPACERTNKIYLAISTGFFQEYMLKEMHIVALIYSLDTNQNYCDTVIALRSSGWVTHFKMHRCRCIKEMLKQLLKFQVGAGFKSESINFTAEINVQPGTKWFWTLGMNEQINSEWT